MKKNRRPLKISYVYDDSLDGSEGVAQYIKTIGEWMAKRGHCVSYLTGETETKTYLDSPVFSLSNNIKVKFNGNRLSIPMFASSSRIKKVLTELQPDVLHVQTPHSPLMAQKVINRAGESAIVATFHIFPANWLAEYGAKILKYAYLRGLSRIDTVVSVSRAAQEFAKSAFGMESEVLPNTIELARFASKQSIIPGRIVFLGRLVPRKGAKELIKAFELVAGQVKDAELIIAGSGEQKNELIELAARLGLSDKIKFLGYIDEKDKAPLLASAHIACFPSLYGESFGIVLIEAMAAGSGAVVGGNNPGYSTVLEDRPELLVDPKDTVSFADKLTRILKSPDETAAHSRWQQVNVRKYDVNVVGQALEQIYLEAIANKTITRHN